MSSKAKGIAQYGFNRSFLRFVEGQVEFGINLGIIRKMIDRRRYKIVIDRQNTRNGFNCAGSTQ